MIEQVLMGVSSIVFLALQTTDGGGGETTLNLPDLIQYGVLGLMFILVLTGQLRLKREVEERDKRLEQQDALINKYQTVYEEDVIPLLHDAVKVISEQQRRDESHGT